MKSLTDLEYVELYAERLKHDNSLFDQQRRLIESQFTGSSSLFKKQFAGAEFKQSARNYLTGIGLL